MRVVAVKDLGDSLTLLGGPVQCDDIVAERGEGRGAATTCSPCLLRGRMTSFQLDPPAQAPWERRPCCFQEMACLVFFLLTPCCRRSALDDNHLYATGHFALETHCQEIAATIRDFLDRNLSLQSGSV
jgi:hypothetical protein